MPLSTIVILRDQCHVLPWSHLSLAARHQNLSAAAPRLTSNDWLRLGSTFHSLHAIASQVQYALSMKFYLRWNWSDEPLRGPSETRAVRSRVLRTVAVDTPSSSCDMSVEAIECYSASQNRAPKISAVFCVCLSVLPWPSIKGCTRAVFGHREAWDRHLQTTKLSDIDRSEVCHHGRGRDPGPGCRPTRNLRAIHRLRAQGVDLQTGSEKSAGKVSSNDFSIYSDAI